MPGDKAWMIFLHAWLILAKAIGWILATCLCAVVMAEPTYRLEPVPQTEPLPPAVEQSTGNADQEDHAPVDARPVVHLYVTTGCAYCVEAKADLTKAGVPIYIPAKNPKWVEAYPTMAWKVGETWQYHYGWTDLATFMREYAPKAAVSAGSPPIDQMKKFLPAGTKITITPPSPIKQRLDDRTVISYQKIDATVSYVGDRMEIKLAQPYPVATYEAWKRWVDIGLQLYGGGGPTEESTKDTQVFRLDTSKGTHNFKVQMTMEPAK